MNFILIIIILILIDFNSYHSNFHFIFLLILENCHSNFFNTKKILNKLKFLLLRLLSNNFRINLLIFLTFYQKLIF